jgi:dTMP kinase
MQCGQFITFEGIDGSGKSTQAKLAAEFFAHALGENRVLWTREPGDWKGGKHIRELLLHGDLLHCHAELYLFLADRCEHVRQVIEPALTRGCLVLCERYCDSTLAYQAWGRGLSRAWIESLFSMSGFPNPNLTLWIDVPVEKAWERLIERGSVDRIESEALTFLHSVRKGYAALAKEDPRRIVRIDGTRAPHLVFADVRTFLKKILKERLGISL